jgi:WXG100 family type VII secretion target
MAMNADELVVKYGGLDGMTTELIIQAKKLDDTISSIGSAMKSVGEGWEGDAHTTYVQVQQAWQKDAAAVHHALQDIARRVHAAGGDYRAGDKKAAGYFQ